MNFLSKSLPIFRSLDGWRTTDLVPDLIAGLTLAAIAIPEQMATARLGGFPPVVGLGAFVAGTLGFAIFGASRCVSVGSDSTIMPIMAGVLATFAAAGSSDYATFAAALALLVGAILVAGGLLKMGWIASLLSVPVIAGFLAGIAIHIAVSQLPSLLGITGSGGSLASKVAAILSKAPHANPLAVGIGGGVLLVTAVAERVRPRFPGALLALVAAASAVALFHLEQRGVSVLGTVSVAQLHFGFPALPASAFARLLPLAFLVSITVMVQTAATARSFASGDGAVDVDRDFLGVGAGSIFAAFAGGFAVNASPPRSAIVREAGGRSQISGFVAAALVTLLAIFGAMLLSHVPTAGLAGILLFIASRLVRVGQLVSIYRRAPPEFLLAAGTSIAIVVLPIQYGVATGIALSLAHGLWTMTRARIIEFERGPGSTIWWPAAREMKGEKVEGVMVVAFQAPLSFLNANDFRRGFLECLAHAKRPLRLIVLEASSIVEIDYTAGQVLAEAIRQAHEEKIVFAIARLESLRAQETLRRLGIVDLVRPERVFRSVQEAIDALGP